MSAISLMQAGDEIDYKRAGVRGVYRCRVVAICADTARPLRVEVLSHRWRGKSSSFVGTRLALTGKRVCRHYRCKDGVFVEI